MKKIDFEALFRSSPYPYLVMDTDLTVVEANQAYLKSTGATREAISGKYLFDAFPINPDDPGSTDMAEVKESLERAIATGMPDSTPFLRYAVPKSSDSDPEFDERYWSTTSTPVLDADGNVTLVVQHPIDVTELYSFNKTDQVASVESKLKITQGADNFNRAQMHEAMLRILNDERGHMRNLFKQAPGFVAVLAGPKHVFQMANEAYYQLVGHRPIIGKPVWEALPEVQGQGFDELLDEVYKTGKAWVGRSMPFVVQREPNGPLISLFIDLLYQPVFNADGSVSGIFAQGHDVTEAYEAQAAYQETEDRLREGMMAAKMTVWDWDVKEKKITFSENAAVILGGMPDTIDKFIEFFHRDDRKKASAAMCRTLDQKTELQETLRLIRPDDGNIIWVDIRGKIRLDKAGEVQAMRGVALDVTDRVRATENLRVADRQKDEFLAMLAHELRNPLAPISAAAQLLTYTQPTQQQLQRTGKIIERQIKHMVGLVDDLLDVSRVTRGLIFTDMSAVNIKAVIAEAIEQSNPAIQSRQHKIHEDLTSEDIFIYGDHKRMVQVITNLLINSTKYTPNGGNITVRLSATRNVATVEVIDDGIGIAPELLPRVFDLFVQAERTVDRTQGGLGIGLALVKSLVEIHGGNVRAFSTPNIGSRFEICLPRINAPTTMPLDQVAERGQSMRILVVDDNEDAANTLALLLETMGHQASAQYTSRAAIEHAVTAAPDIFLLDIGLPDMDGNALVRYLRAQPETATTLMIAVTGYGAEEHRREALAAGFDEYLVKPIDIVALERLISAHTHKALN